MHHPHVACDPHGHWRWTCQCGAGGHGQTSHRDWHWALVAALVHTAAMPGE